MRSIRRAGLTGLLTLALGMCAMPAAAQVSTGEIFGKVADNTGAVLPGVTVTLTSPALIQPQSAVSQASGGFRFPNVPIGTYSVVFELPGFKKLVHENVVIQAGFNAEINPKLELSSVEETVTVSGESPVVDTRSTQLGSSFNQKALQEIPTARDPWEIIQQTAGITMTTENVGGNGSGQQPGFNANGTNSQLWTMDGGTITDTSSNSSPTYYDFDSFEEMTINTGGGDASQQSGGITVNLITKSGSNRFKGTARYYVTDDKFESQNVTDDLRRQGAGAGNPIQNIKDFGFEVGGPIARNRAWFWGSRARNDIKVGVIGFLIDPAGDPNDRNNLRTDLTRLDDTNIKINYQFNRNNKTTGFWSRGDKIRNARGVSSTTPIEAATRQSGPSDIYRLQHQWVVTDSLTIDAQVSHVDGGFLLDFQDASLVDVQQINYVDQGRVARSTTNYNTIRPQWETRVDGNYYLPKKLGGDHSLKFGYRYRTTPIESISQVGGGATVRIRASGANEADITRDADFNVQRYDSDFFVSDTYKVNRLTANIGLRLDQYRDKALSATTPANRILPDLLPAINYPGAESGVRWNNWQPRLGLSYDIFGSGKTVAKASVSRYYGITMNTAGTLQPTGLTTLRYAWTDLNSDLTVQRNELDLARGFLTTPSSNYDPLNPSSVTTPATVDPNLENSRTFEVTAGVDHELMNNFAVGFSYIHRKYDDLAATFRVGVSSDEVLAGILQRGVRQHRRWLAHLRPGVLHGHLLRPWRGASGGNRAAQLRLLRHVRWRAAHGAEALQPALDDVGEPCDQYRHALRPGADAGLHRPDQHRLPERRPHERRPLVDEVLRPLRAAVGYLDCRARRLPVRIHVQHEHPVAQPSQQPRNGQRSAAGKQRSDAADVRAGGPAPGQDHPSWNDAAHRWRDGVQRVQQQRRAGHHHAAEPDDGQQRDDDPGAAGGAVRRQVRVLERVLRCGLVA